MDVSFYSLHCILAVATVVVVFALMHYLLLGCVVCTCRRRCVYDVVPRCLLRSLSDWRMFMCVYEYVFCGVYAYCTLHVVYRMHRASAAAVDDLIHLIIYCCLNDDTRCRNISYLPGSVSTFNQITFNKINTTAYAIDVEWLLVDILHAPLPWCSSAKLSPETNVQTLLYQFFSKIDLFSLKLVTMKWYVRVLSKGYCVVDD